MTPKWVAEQEAYNPNVDIVATIKKGAAVYWGVETEGYQNKIKSKAKEINWKKTFAKNMDKNVVWKSRQHTKSATATDIPLEQNSFAIACGLVPKSTEFKEV